MLIVLQRRLRKEPAHDFERRFDVWPVHFCHPILCADTYCMKAGIEKALHAFSGTVRPPIPALPPP
jgi:hypothetical protein